MSSVLFYSVFFQIIYNFSTSSILRLKIRICKWSTSVFDISNNSQLNNISLQTSKFFSPAKNYTKEKEKKKMEQIIWVCVQPQIYCSQFLVIVSTTVKQKQTDDTGQLNKLDCSEFNRILWSRFTTHPFPKLFTVKTAFTIDFLQYLCCFVSPISYPIVVHFFTLTFTIKYYKVSFNAIIAVCSGKKKRKKANK